MTARPLNHRLPIAAHAAGAPGPRTRRPGRGLPLALLGFAAAIGAWYLAVDVLALPRFSILPGPSEVLREWTSRDPAYGVSIWTSSYYADIWARGQAADGPSRARVSGAVSIRDAGKAYGDVVALERCSLEIAPGELHVIVGPSGCGKTTLLNAIAGFHGLTEGEILLDGEPLPAQPGGDRVVVFQHSALFPWRTVLDNVIYGPVAQRRLARDDARELAPAKLSHAGLADVADHYPAQLSSGVQRRVEIVRALINEPRVLLLDEPFRGMDRLTRSVMHGSLLEFYARAGVTVLFITHDIDEAVFLGSRVSVMTTRPGRIKQTIDIDLARPRDYRVLTEPRFVELCAAAADAVRGEARLAFATGERELA